MSLISTLGKVVINPIDEEFKKAIAMSGMMAHQLERSHTALFNHIWNNSATTPEEILQKYGTDAVKLFQISKAIQDILIAVNPNYKTLIPPCQVYFREDGSATTIKPE